MGRRRSQRACATLPSMLTSERGAAELHRPAAEAEVSSAAAAAAGSEAAGPADRGTNRGGRGPAATTSSTGVAERAEHLGDSPARKPDPEPGRMDHHQPGTGRYQVVSFRSPPRPPPPGDPETVSRRGRESPFPQIIPCGDVLAVFWFWDLFFFFWLFWRDPLPSHVLGSLPLTRGRPFHPDPSPSSLPLTCTLYPAVTPPNTHTLKLISILFLTFSIISLFLDPVTSETFRWIFCWERYSVHIPSGKVIAIINGVGGGGKECKHYVG